MIYKITIKPKAQKKLLKLPPKVYKLVKSAVFSLSENPRPFGYKELTGRDGYRIKTGVYRIIYDIDDEVIIIDVLEIDHRKNVYRR